MSGLKTETEKPARENKDGGNVGGGRRRSTLAAKFFGKVMPEPNSGCWLWIGTVNDEAMVADRRVYVVLDGYDPAAEADAQRTDLIADGVVRALRRAGVRAARMP